MHYFRNKKDVTHLKILKPIRFDGLLGKGGSTKPWAVSCIDEDAMNIAEISCALKLFSPSHVANAKCIGKEFLCNKLALAFDLGVLEAYLIDAFDPDFYSTLDVEAQQDLATRFKGISFGSKLIDATILNPQIKSNVFDIHDCAMVFAFDCLILNQDRGGHRNKPNLMLNDDGLTLIDHELTFHFIDGDQDDSYNAVMVEFQHSAWFPIYRTHIFYQRLKRYRSANKQNLFDTFEEYLGKLDINAIEVAVAQLEKCDITVGQKELLFQYLRILKKETHKFCKILLSLIA
jgi:hypothetical protein